MKIEFESLPNYGDLFTIVDFKRDVDCGALLDYDGYGYLSNGYQVAYDFVVYPSLFKRGKVAFEYKKKEIIDIPKWATHVIWFNR
jgi:hypothetical protein